MGLLNTLTEARDTSYGYLSRSSKKVARAGAGCWSPVAIDADVEAWKKRWSTDTRFMPSAGGAPKSGSSDVDIRLYWPMATEDMLFKAGTMSNADGDVPPSATRCPPAAPHQSHPATARSSTSSSRTTTIAQGSPPKEV